MQITRSATQSRAPSKSPTGKNQKTNINKEIGILLASYARAINKEQERSGSLFRQKTKAECVTCNKGITPSFLNTQSGTLIKTPNHENLYTQRCFDYIHHNPVKAGLVKRAIDWEFCSYRDYCGKSNGALVNKRAAKEAGIIFGV